MPKIITSDKINCTQNISQSQTKNDNTTVYRKTTLSRNKDEKTIMLEGGNYVGFGEKSKIKHHKSKISTPVEFKTTERTINSRKSVKKKMARSFNCKHQSPRRRTSNSRDRKILNPMKAKSNNNSFSYADMAIESKSYYHGLRPIEDFVNYLTNPGDYLVHITQVNNDIKYFLVLLNCDDKIEIHTIENENGQHYLNSVGKYHKTIPTFKCIPQLIDYYRKHHIYDKSILKCKLKRPSHFINHASISYDSKNGTIGQGNFATVFKGTLNEKEFKELAIAVKIFALPNENDTNEIKTDRLLQVLSEAKVMKNLSNQHIVQFYGISIDKYPISIVMEMCLGGSLENHLKIEKDKICVGEKLFYCHDILNGACYLSSHNIVHKDLAARNVLISNDGFLKIGDFGQAINLKGNKQVYTVKKKNNNVISLWSPPECLSNNSTAWSEKSDVWSFGIICVEIFNEGQPPFKKDDAFNVVSQLKKGIYFDIPKSCHEDWRLVLKEGVFIKEQSNRFNFKQLRELLKALLTYNSNLIIPQGENIALNRRGVKRVEFKISEKDYENLQSS